MSLIRFATFRENSQRKPAVHYANLNRVVSYKSSSINDHTPHLVLYSHSTCIYDMQRITCCVGISDRMFSSKLRNSTAKRTLLWHFCDNRSRFVYYASSVYSVRPSDRLTCDLWPHLATDQKSTKSLLSGNVSSGRINSTIVVIPAGLPKSRVMPLQRIQNTTTRLIRTPGWHDHVTTTLHDLQALLNSLKF